MSDDNSTSAFTITLKAGQHYDAPWIVVRAETTPDLLNRLESLGQSGVIAKTVEVAAELQGVYAAAKGLPAAPVAVEVAPTAVVASPTTPAPLTLVPQAPVAAPTGPVCQHGPMVWRESKPGAAKPWRAFMCPTEKGTPGQCEPQWQR